MKSQIKRGNSLTQLFLIQEKLCLTRETKLLRCALLLLCTTIRLRQQGQIYTYFIKWKYYVKKASFKRKRVSNCIIHFFPIIDIRLVIFHLDNQNTVTKYLCKGRGSKERFFSGDSIFGSSCVPKSLPPEDNPINRELQVI